MTTLGLHSPKLDAVRALRTKAGRREQGRFAAEGPTMFAEALAAGREPEAVYATEAGLAALGPLAVRIADRLFVVPEKAMARLSDLDTPPGILAVHVATLAEPAALLADGAPAIVLAGIGDPGNAGTLLRTAEIFGIRAAFFVRDSVEPHNPKTVRATMGAIFRMALAQVEPDELVASARSARYTIVAATRDGTPLPEFRFPERALLAIGNERRGVVGSLPSWDRAVAIPQAGAGESLNAAVAGGIIFYAFSQQARPRILGPKP
jgi:TrmH family RNA methyltransferase